MDEKLVEQVSSATGIPQMLVSRTAQARAAVSGVSVDDVLRSWSGGEAIQSSPSATTEVEAVSPVADEEVAVNSTEVEEEQVEEVEIENIVEPIQTTVLIKEDLPPPVNISEKILKSFKFGLGFGIVAGFVQGLLSSSYLYDGLILEAETQKLIAEYNALSFVLIISLSTSFLGILNSLNIKKFLDSKKINYEYIIITNNKKASEFVQKINNGKKIIPTIDIDGKVYANPNISELNKILITN